MPSVPLKSAIPLDFPSRIKRLRDKFGLTQMRLAERMGVSFASVNRWENGQSRPSALAWQQITRAEMLGLEALGTWSDAQSLGRSTAADEASKLESPPGIDFSADHEVVRVIAEGERLRYGHLFNPSFATAISLIDPLPHQRIAVGKIGIFDRQTHIFHETQPRPIEQTAHESGCTTALCQDGCHFFPCADGRSTMRAFGAFACMEVWKGLFEPMPIQKKQGIERAILGRGSHLAMHSPVREKSTDLLCSHLFGVTLVMKQDKTSAPTKVRFFCAEAKAISQKEFPYALSQAYP